MKTIGLIGGMSWESTLEYYRILNEKAKARMGGFHSAKCILYSVDFAEVEKLQHEEKWDEATRVMIDAAQRVERAGADFLLICTNTMHKMAEEVQESIQIPLLHIVDVLAHEIKAKSLKKVGLLGTKFTMEEVFYRGRLSEKHGIKVIIPDEEERDAIHRFSEFYANLSPMEERTGSKPTEIPEKGNAIDASKGQRSAEALLQACNIYLSEVEVVPRLTNIGDALRLRRDKRILDFRQTLSAWATELRTGDFRAERRIRHDIRKANEELRKLGPYRRISRWAAYVALPVALVETLTLGIPAVGTALAAVSGAVQFISDRTMARHRWMLLGR